MSFFDTGTSLNSLIDQIDSVILPSIKPFRRTITINHWIRAGGGGGRGGIQPRQTNVAATPGDMALVKETEPSRCSEKLGRTSWRDTARAMPAPKSGLCSNKKTALNQCNTSILHALLQRKRVHRQTHSALLLMPNFYKKAHEAIQLKSCYKQASQTSNIGTTHISSFSSCRALLYLV